jgi:hypothetical protein
MIVWSVPEIMDHHGGSRATAKCFDGARHAKASVDQLKIDSRTVYSAPYRRVVGRCLLGRQRTDRPSPFRNWAQVGMMETKPAAFDCAVHAASVQQVVDPRAIAVDGINLGAAVPQRQQRASAPQPNSTIRLRSRTKRRYKAVSRRDILKRDCQNSIKSPKLCTCPSEGANTTCDARALSERD